MVCQLKSFVMWVKTIESDCVQVGSHHVHQFELALLLDRHHIDEGLVEHSSFGQLGDDLGGLAAAWWRDVHLLGEPDMSVLQSKERVVGSHSDLQEWRVKEAPIRMCTHSLNGTKVLGVNGAAYMSSWVIPHHPLGCKNVPCMDKVT